MECPHLDGSQQLLLTTLCEMGKVIFTSEIATTFISKKKMQSDKAEEAGVQRENEKEDWMHIQRPAETADVHLAGQCYHK